jgi:hypothetical protein
MVRFFFWMILAWGLAGNAVAQMAKLDTLCDRQELFRQSNGAGSTVAAHQGKQSRVARAQHLLGEADTPR